MLKVMKEIIIMLLICLVALLILAVIFYEYIPARKVVAEVTTYTTPEKIAGLLADDIDEKENDVILTFEEGEYEVTSKDLKNYEATDKYVPGKSNPFAAVPSEVTDEDNTNTTSTNTTNTNTSTNTNANESTTNSTSSNKSNTTSKGSLTSKNEDNSYIPSKGTK